MQAFGSPSKLSITFTLDYTTTTSTTGSCEVSFGVFDFRTRFNVASGKPAVNVLIESRAKDYVIFNVDSAETASQIQNAMYTQFLPGESQGRGSLVGCRLWGRTESDTTEAT